MQRLKAGETAESRADRRRRPDVVRPPALAADDLLEPASGSRSTGSTRSCCGSPSAAIRCPAMRSSATSRSVAGSRSTATTAPTSRSCARIPSASRRSAWDGDAETSFQVEIEVQGWDRHRLLEDLSRTFAEAGINILEARCTVNHPMIRNQFVVEVGDTRTLDQAITACATSTTSSTPTGSRPAPAADAGSAVHSARCARGRL